MPQENKKALIGKLKAVAPYLLVVAAAFLIYRLYTLIVGFPGDYLKYQSVANSVANNGYTFWPIYWLTSEYIGTTGLILGCAGAVFLFAFAVVLLRRKQFALEYLRKGVFLTTMHFLLLIPIVGFIFFSPNATLSYHLAAVSYTIQLFLIVPSLLMLYSKLHKPQVDSVAVLRWGAVAAISFAFALWAKHFIFSLYTLPIDLSNNLLVAGSLNSTFTILFGALLLTFALMPVLKGKGSLNPRVLGAGLCFIGAYFVIYLLISLVNLDYLNWLMLIELWAVSLMVLGVGFLIQKSD